MTTGSNRRAVWRLGQVHHIGITVSDIERSIAFYRDVLGLILVRRRPRVAAGYVARQTGYKGVVLSVASLSAAESGPTIELAQYLTHHGKPIAAQSNQAGNSHLCLVVDDLRTCHADLESKGVDFRSNPVPITAGPNKGGWIVYLSDPDGYTIELFQPPRARGSDG